MQSAMSASSRSTIFSLRSKKSKDSGELAGTHAGPAYDDLPMSPRGPPITVATIVPPSQQHNGSTVTRAYQDGRYYGETGGDQEDVYGVRSESRNGHGVHGSLRGGSLGGPRPLPPRSGSAEKMPETPKYNNFPLPHGESPNVLPPHVTAIGMLIGEKLHKKRASSDHGSTRSRMSNASSLASRAISPPLITHDPSRFKNTVVVVLIIRNSIYSYLSVTPNGDVHLDRPKDDKIIDELFNDLMVPPNPPLPTVRLTSRTNETLKTSPPP